jgi:hypothetical protein
MFRSQLAVINLARWVCILSASMPMVSGCSVLVDAERPQCTTDEECTSRGPAFAGSACVESVCQASPRWACLDEPAPPLPGGGPYDITFFVRDAVSLTPRSGMLAKLCRRLDVGCAEPVSHVAVVDDEGYVGFQVAEGFNGYARFDGPDSLIGLYFFNPPVYEDKRDIPVSLSSPTTVGGLAALTGATQEPERGIVLLSVLDCTGALASGVTITANEADPGSKAFYALKGLPSPSATQTDDTGYGGVVNASPGTMTFVATLEENGLQIDEMTVLIQPGTQTMTTLVPRGR